MVFLTKVIIKTSNSASLDVNNFNFIKTIVFKMLELNAIGVYVFKCLSPKLIFIFCWIILSL